MHNASFQFTESNNLLSAGAHGFPMYNPETGQWMGLGMYPFPTPFFPQAAIPPPEYYQNAAMPYRGFRGGYRGRFMRGGRSRGSYKGRSGYHDSDYNKKYDDYDDEYDNRDSRGRNGRRDRRR